MEAAKCAAWSVDTSVRYSIPVYGSRMAAWRPAAAVRCSDDVNGSHVADLCIRRQQQLQELATGVDQLQMQLAAKQQPLQEQPQQPPSLLQQGSILCSQHVKYSPCAATPSGSDASIVNSSCKVSSRHLARASHHSLDGGPVYSHHSHQDPHSSSSSSTTSSSSRPSSSKSEGKQPKPEPPAAAGAPPKDSSGSSSSSSKQQADQAGVSKQQNDVQASSSSSTASEDIDAAVDAMLEMTWKELKKDLKKDLPPEQAAMIDKWEVGDIQTDKVFREIAEQQLGPILELMGIREDPYTFFIDMFKLALMLQLLSAAVVFYGVELGLGLDAGDGYRAVTGLALGYFLRLSIKIENLAWPLYNAIVQLLIQDNAVYEPTEATAEDRQTTLNKLGLAIACSFLIPKLFFGWQNDDCWQIVVPMVGGLFFFDVCYILALLIKLWGRDEE